MSRRLRAEKREHVTSVMSSIRSECFLLLIASLVKARAGEESCSPIKKIAFVKTHKTGSSTIHVKIDHLMKVLQAFLLSRASC